MGALARQTRRRVVVGAMTAQELDRFHAWSLERAREVRHIAAALGWPAEYAFLRHRDHIEALLRRDFPGAGHMLDCVGSDCERCDIEMDLAEINRIRDEDGLPPLDFVPDVEARPRFPPPKPKVPPPPDEVASQFHQWMVKQVSTAYHAAAARRTTAEDEMSRLPYILVGEIMRRFPTLNPAACLRDLFDGLMFYRPETIDQKRVEFIREWSGLVFEVADKIEASMAATTTDALKQ